MARPFHLPLCVALPKLDLMELVITLLLAGFILLVLETFLPGIVAGAAGVVCILIANVMAYANVGVEAGNWTLALSAAMLVGVTVAYVRFLPHSPFARLFISNRVSADPKPGETGLVGRVGMAETVLRPSGVVVIDGRRIDVSSDGPLIEKGETVKVVLVEGMRVVVSRESTNS
jgi:membrane-bound ClpP family serine protease